MQQARQYLQNVINFCEEALLLALAVGVIFAMFCNDLFTKLAVVVGHWQVGLLPSFLPSSHSQLAPPQSVQRE